MTHEPTRDSPRRRSPYELWRDDQGRLCSDEQGVLPDGPWHGESDRVSFSCAGHPCLLLRHEIGGHWCGYVGLPDGHLWERISSDGVLEDDAAQVPRGVHGGISFSGRCGGERPCSLARWWIGIDCGHMGSGDLVLGPRLMRDHSLQAGCTYRDLVYARAELEGLAQQVARVALAVQH